MTENKPLLEVKNLKLTFSSKSKGGKKKLVRAIDDVSFNIYPGEIFGLVGESGCGKTTTGRTIIRLYDPDEGQIIYKGREISGKMDSDLRKYLTDNIAMIFQDPVSSLNPRMTIKEIIGEGLTIRGVTNEAIKNNLIYEMLENVGLQREHATRYPHEFSGGQRQRIGIARALVVQPSLIIADEPVSALDVSIQAQIINLLQNIKEQMELTIMFVAHDLSVVKYFSDRIGVMYFGKLVEIAPADELYNNPIHPYTKSLISAIPQPDPVAERRRQRIYYDPKIHDYTNSTPSLKEIKPEHFVYGSDEEFENYKKELNL